MIENFIKDELIFINEQSVDRESLFSKLGNKLYKNGYVTKEYGHKLNERENSFPTAIELESYSFAIPHTDPQYTLKPFISVVTMKEPVLMNRMDDQDKSTEVNVMFVLGFNDGSSHLDVLKVLINKLQDSEVIKSLLEIDTVNQLEKYIKETFKESK